MKKIFTLLAAALVSAGAFAIAPKDVVVTSAKLSPKGLEMINEPVRAYEANATELDRDGAVVKRSFTQGNSVYDASFVRRGVLTDFWILTMNDPDAPGGERPATFDDLPYYVVLMQMQRSNKSTGAQTALINCYVTWPSYLGWTPEGKANPNGGSDNDMVTMADFASAPSDDAGAIEFGTTNIFAFTPVLVDETDPTSYSIYSLFPMEYYKDASQNPDETFIGSWPIWSPVADVASYFGTNNEPANLTSEAPNISTFSLNSYEADESEEVVEMPFNFFFDNSEIVDGTYEGSIMTKDMVLYDYNLDISEVHIWDLGVMEQSNDDDYYYPYGYPDNASWSPVHRYYFFVICKPGVLGYSNQASADVVAFNPEYIGGSLTSAEQAVSSNWRWFQGALFCPENATSPLGYEWSMSKPVSARDYDPMLGSEIQIDKINPIAGHMVPGGYDSADANFWSASDGVYGVFNQFYWYPNDNCWMALGTPEGFKMKFGDMAGNTMNVASYKEQIYFHPDKNDMKKYEMISPVGDYKDTGAVEGIGADEFDGVATYYNLQGVRVANPENGIFVKVAGSKASKVVIK